MENKAKWLVIALVSVAVFLALLFLVRGIASIVSKNSNQAQKTSNKPVPIVKLTVSAANIIKDPLVYDGLTVEINSNVSDWITKNVFALNAGSSSLLGGTSGQLIVASSKKFTLNTSSDQKGLGLGENANVHIRGRVIIVNREEFKRITGIDLDGSDIKLDDNKISNWKEGPIIILDSVEKL